MVKSATRYTLDGSEFTVWICEAGHEHWAAEWALECPQANKVVEDAQAEENESRQEPS